MAPKKISETEQWERERIGATLRMARIKEGWDLGPFATKLGISYSYLSNIEAGRKPLTGKLLARAAKVLDIAPMSIRHPSAEAPHSEAS